MRICVCAVVLLAACGARSSVPAPGARAELIDTNGRTVASALLYQQTDGVLIRADVKSMPAGVHGFHIHTTGSCEPPFQSAGGHLNPTNKKHGQNNPEGAHAGDLPNVTVAADGTARAEIVARGVQISTLFDVDGASLVMHAAADDYVTDPAGNSGARVACGVIRR